MSLRNIVRGIGRRNPVVRKIWRWIKYRRAVRRLRGPKIIRQMERLYPQAFFIQIGANDGDQLDPLRTAVHRSGWRGIMVEPVPYVFRKLASNNGHLASRVKLENVAIADVCGTLPFWHLPQADAGEGLPRLYDALGSFHKDVVLKHVNFIPDIEDRIVCTNVDCITLEELCRRNQVDAIDVLQIDTEGYDFEIIKMIDFTIRPPSLLIYEHHHFDEHTDRECRQYLRERGYRLFKEGMDTWCLRSGQKGGGRTQRLERYWQNRGGDAGFGEKGLA